MGNPRTLAKLWTFYPSGPPLEPVPSWNPNAAQPNDTIYQVLRQNAIQNILTVCVGSLLGSILLIMTINHIPRTQFLKWSFICLAMLFAMTGGSFFSVFHTNMHAVTIVLVALCHFAFSFGTLYLSVSNLRYLNQLTAP
jgi:PHS family inorganic phosphate transporter-like MFS transporter